MVHVMKWFGHGKRARQAGGTKYDRRALVEALEDRRLLTAALGSMTVERLDIEPALGGMDVQTTPTEPGATPIVYNTRVGVFQFKRVGGTYSGLPAVDGQFGALCLEVNQHARTRYYDVVGLTDAPVPGDLNAGPMNASTAEYMRELWGRYYGSIGADDIKGAAFQLAVWEIVHDSRFDLSGGVFSVATPMSPNTAKAMTQATTWLQSLDGQGPKASLLVMSDPTYQDLIFEAPAASLGDKVWEDLNANGVQEAGESGIANVTVQLYTSGGVLAGTTVTDADGVYHFTNLVPGDYCVQFTKPDGYYLSASDQGGDDALDSDADALGKTVVTTLSAGENDLTWDAGMYRKASLGDYVWRDGNFNGIQDGGEAGVGGVTVKLYSGDTLVATQTTDASGQYLFSDLMPGAYSVQFTAPCGYLFTSSNQVDDAKDSDADADTGATGSYALISGQSNRTVDAGLYKTNGYVRKGMTATIGFWHNKNGQAVLNALNGGPNQTMLGTWLGTMFPNLFGAGAGENNLLGKSNSCVANYFKTKFSASGAKVEAQVLAVAFGVYVTNANLAGSTLGSKYGFDQSGVGLGAALYNVGSCGQAFGVPNNTSMTVLQLLQATDAQAVGGALYGGNWSLRVLANDVFDGINNKGDI